MHSPFPEAGQVPAWVEAMLRYLGHAFPAWRPTAGTGVVYYDALQDIDPRAIGDAARAYVREGHEFAPSAGQLRKAALAMRRASKPHAEDCDCLACINALPVADRWMRMSPTMRAMFERDQPDTARALREASRALYGDRVDGVRKLLGCVKSVGPLPRLET